jgi:hypothetical protein
MLFSVKLVKLKKSLTSTDFRPLTDRGSITVLLLLANEWSLHKGQKLQTGPSKTHGQKTHDYSMHIVAYCMPTAPNTRLRISDDNKPQILKVLGALSA